MSKLIALALTLVTGAGVASAAPHRTFIRDRDSFDRYDHRGDIRRDRRFDDDLGPRRYRRTWVQLGALELANDGRDAVQVYDRGTFTQLRLQTTGARVHVDAVAIKFADGGHQTVRLDRTLGGYDRFLEIPLDGNNRRIQHITVIGGSRHGGLQVFGI